MGLEGRERLGVGQDDKKAPAPSSFKGDMGSVP